MSQTWLNLRDPKESTAMTKKILKRDFLKQRHLPTQHFLNPVLGPQTTLLNDILQRYFTQPTYNLFITLLTALRERQSSSPAHP